MRRVRMFWHIYPAFLAILVLAVVALILYVDGALRQFHYDQVAARLRGLALSSEDRFMQLLADGRRAETDALAKEIGKRTDARLTIILPDGEVVGDTAEDPARMENHADRPEVKSVLREGHSYGRSRRYSVTTKMDRMYMALPIMADGRIIAVTRTSLPLTEVNEALGAVHRRILLGGVAVAALASLASLLISRRLSRPLEEMKTAAQGLARGELHARVPAAASDEMASLAEAMNAMAAELDDRLRTVVRQRNEQDAVLASMVEGVVAIDRDEQLLNINRAAAQFFGVEANAVRGRPLREVIRNADLQRFVAAALASEQAAAEGEVVLPGENGGHLLQARGGALRDAEGRAMGLVVCLNDVTRLRRLENVRRDFVANVSHELRTPITSIKGFVETLLEGGLADTDEVRRFLGIVARQVDRLNAIIEDLLSLSRLEGEGRREDMALASHLLRPVLAAAIATCQVKARERGVQVTLACDEALAAPMAPELIEQAVVNLIDNAVKYSESGAAVNVSAGGDDEAVRIRVHDTGCGIERQHLPRIFERFYRVDRARSRKLGGTGLGLAIVKHIALCHRGDVAVDSAPGQGSTFTIRLPRAAKAGGAPEA